MESSQVKRITRCGKNVTAKCYTCLDRTATQELTWPAKKTGQSHLKRGLRSVPLFSAFSTCCFFFIISPCVFFLFFLYFLFLCKRYRLLQKSFRSFGEIPLKRVLRISPEEFIGVLEVFKSPSLILFHFFKCPWSIPTVSFSFQY